MQLGFVTPEQTILGIDPGKTTGWSLIRVGSDASFALLESGQVGSGYEGVIAWLSDTPFALYTDRIVCEDFILRRGSAMTSDQIAPERGIGVVAAFAHSFNIPLTLIPPSRNKTITNDDLKQLGLWGQPGHENRHQRDASRVVVRYVKDQTK